MMRGAIAVLMLAGACTVPSPGDGDEGEDEEDEEEVDVCADAEARGAVVSTDIAARFGDAPCAADSDCVFDFGSVSCRNGSIDTPAFITNTDDADDARAVHDAGYAELCAAGCDVPGPPLEAAACRLGTCRAISNEQVCAATFAPFEEAAARVPEEPVACADDRDCDFIRVTRDCGAFAFDGCRVVGVADAEADLAALEEALNDVACVALAEGVGCRSDSECVGVTVVCNAGVCLGLRGE